MVIKVDDAQVLQDDDAQPMYDAAWKHILAKFLFEFIAFFIPELYKKLDLEKTYDDLSTDLVRLLRDAEIGDRRADLLFRVYLKSGEVKLLLIHLEIQASRVPNFPLRMFVYHYRIFDYYKMPLVSLALLCDDDPTWEPGSYTHGEWGCRVTFDFPAIKVATYNTEEGRATLETSGNIISFVMIAQIDARAEPERRFATKLGLMRRACKVFATTPEVLVELVRCLDLMMVLAAKDRPLYQAAIHALEEEYDVPIISDFERMSLEKGLQEGRVEGRVEGRMEGRVEGRVEGRAALCRELLEDRFASVPAWVDEKLAAADGETITRWSKRVFRVERIEDVFATNGVKPSVNGAKPSA